MDIKLSSSDATFIGEYSGDLSGRFLASNGDVNGDGYDDILIGAYFNDEGGSNAGQTYLIFGSGTVIDAEEAIEDLNDYIQGLSNSYFKNNANNRKNAFDNKIDSILKMLDDDNLIGVITKLENNIRDKADGEVDGQKGDDWILNIDAQRNICRMIDEIILYLENAE